MKTGCFAEPILPNCGFFKTKELRDDFDRVSRNCFFYEDKGKDISFPRWRVCFYYASHLAITKFFDSEDRKNRFLSGLTPATANTYNL